MDHLPPSPSFVNATPGPVNTLALEQVVDVVYSSDSLDTI